MPSSNHNNKEFFILSPPPNVTGSLHIGHAFTFTIQDFIVRLRKNFLNEDAFLLGGFDHGGLASEKSAEKAIELSTDRVTRFLQIQQFANNAKNNIDNQFKKLNLLMPDKYKKYTFDEDHALFVQQSFINLYQKGLIKRDFGIVNFDTKFKTSVSDLEVTRTAIKSKIFMINYKLLDCKNINGEDFIEVFTTRPETIFADMAICVNPTDTRYQHLIGHRAIIPIINKAIPIISDEYVDINFGSGALKITPAHDLNDYKIWQKHLSNEKIINIINKDGQIVCEHLSNDPLVLKYHHLSIEQAREQIVQDLILPFEYIDQTIPIGERSGAPIEHLLLEQWFFDVSDGAKLALENINKIPIYPEIWRNTYQNWLNNINPLWCISRATVWGHEIPAYFNSNGEIKVQIEHPGDGWTKNNEVFDTWFSAALWPLTYKNAFNKYPSDVLVTAYDILFFWVARMVMMNLILDKSLPFKNVFLHRLVTDKEGKKMSKTVGNVIDPLEIIQNFGCDTLRLCLLKTLSPCGKIRLSEDLINDSQCIITKLKNFGLYLKLDHDIQAVSTSDQKIINYFRHQLFIFEQKILDSLQTYELHLIVQDLIGFLYEICGWFLEFSKIRKSLIPELTRFYFKLLALFNAIIPAFDNNFPVYILENKSEQIYEIGELKRLISDIRSYKKLGIQIEISDCEFSDIICRMTNVNIGNNGKQIKINNFSYFLNNIQPDIIKRKISNLKEELTHILKFLEKTSDNTPENILTNKINHRICVEKELQILKELI